MKVMFMFLICILCTIWGCAPSPQPIVYGEDACHSCLMTIVDERHAAELVTSKGKVYKFDAIECMAHSLEEEKDRHYALALVCDYDNPGTFIDAYKASYLVSPSIPSPMGAFLSAFATSNRATEMQQEKGGQLYIWESLPDAINL